MVGFSHLICATTREEYDRLGDEFRAQQAAKPTTEQVLRDFANRCVHDDGSPIDADAQPLACGR